jgi:hypothetical protein
MTFSMKFSAFINQLFYERIAPVEKVSKFPYIGWKPWKLETVRKKRK